MASKQRKALRLLTCLFLIIYLAVLMYVCFFSERYGRGAVSEHYRYNLIPFKEIRRFFTYRDILGAKAFVMNMFGNVFVFMPFGFMTAVMSSKFRSFIRAAAVTLVLSMMIETVQLVCRVGTFDVDDLILNTFGGWLGYAVFSFADWLRHKITATKR